MHTADLMKTAEFTFLKDQREISLSDILTDFKPGDRIGVVSMTPGDSLNAAPLLLAAVGAYYEALRETEHDFYLYPDFFVFHLGKLHCYHSALDVWPQSKEVVVPPDPQALLAAINDRGVHHLVLPDRMRSAGTVMLHAAQLAERRVKTVLTTAGAHTQSNHAVVSVKPSAAAARMIAIAARRSSRLLGEALVDYWTQNSDAGRHYSHTDVEDALRILCSIGETDSSFGFGEQYRADCGITETTLGRDTYRACGDNVEAGPCDVSKS